MEFDMVQLYQSKISRATEKNMLSVPNIHFAQESNAHTQEHQVQVTRRTTLQIPITRASTYYKFAGVIRKL